MKSQDWYAASTARVKRELKVWQSRLSHARTEVQREVASMHVEVFRDVVERRAVR